MERLSGIKKRGLTEKQLSVVTQKLHRLFDVKVKKIRDFKFYIWDTEKEFQKLREALPREDWEAFCAERDLDPDAIFEEYSGMRV